MAKPKYRKLNYKDAHCNEYYLTLENGMYWTSHDKNNQIVQWGGLDKEAFIKKHWLKRIPTKLQKSIQIN
jgi:hypothetical protein